MSVALIEESAKEVRRLAIAGSPLAVGDFRLKKLIAPLEQAGAKVPVFGQVAKAISELVNGKEADSAANLLSLSTLLNAILYTQGQTSVTGEHKELESFPTRCASTNTSARVLKPLIEALTSTGGGRFEIIKLAVERGAFNDLRLIEPAIRALEDTYPELAELVAEKILPAYGPGIAPLLRQKLELKGKKSDARRLSVLHKLEPEGTIALCKTALESGSPDVKAEAIACLGKHEECLPLVMEQANSKNKVLRAAALEALAEHERPEVTKLFAELIKGKTLELLARPLRVMRNQVVLGSLIAEGERVFGLVAKGESEQIPRFSEILDCLDERKDAEVEKFLLVCFSQSDKLGKMKAAKDSHITGADLLERLSALLYEIGTPAALEAVLGKRETLPPISFTQVLGSALRRWPADKVYQEFGSLLEEKKGAGKQKSEIIQHTIRVACGGFVDEEIYFEEYFEEGEEQPLKNVKWDPRWLDAGIKADKLVVVYCLARPGHKGAIAYLLKQLEAKNQTESGLIIRALARCQHANLTDTFLEAIKKKTKGAKYFDYDLQFLFRSARHLPKSDLPKLDAFAANLDEKFVDKYLEALEPLRTLKSDGSDRSDGSDNN